MKKEEEVQRENTNTSSSISGNNNNTTSAMAQTKENPYGDDGGGVAYYPTPNSFHGTDSNNVHPHSVGHRPMEPYLSSSLQPNLPPPSMGPYYPQSGGYHYLPEPGFGYAAPAPPPPPQHYHPAQTQPVYYGPWPGANAAPPIDRQVHYPIYQILPPDAQRPRRKHSFQNDRDQHYGSLEHNAFEARENNQSLAWALDYVNRNPNATLFDVKGKVLMRQRSEQG